MIDRETTSPDHALRLVDDDPDLFAVADAHHARVTARQVHDAVEAALDRAHRARMAALYRQIEEHEAQLRLAELQADTAHAPPPTATVTPAPETVVTAVTAGQVADAALPPLDKDDEPALIAELAATPLTPFQLMRRYAIGTPRATRLVDAAARARASA